MATQAPHGVGQNPAYRPAHRHLWPLVSGWRSSCASRGSTPSTTRDTTIGRAPALASNGECDRPGCDSVKRAMGLIWLRAQAELRVKWRAFVILAVVVGLGGGVALAAFAGARRTDGAMPQFVAYSQPDDGGFIFGSASAPPVATGATAQLACPCPIGTAHRGSAAGCRLLQSAVPLLDSRSQRSPQRKPQFDRSGQR